MKKRSASAGVTWEVVVGDCGVCGSDNGAGEYVLEDLYGVLLALGAEGRNAVEGIGDAEFLVFEGAHGVVGQQLYSLHHGVLGDVLCQGGEVCVVVGAVGYNNVANPCGFLDLLQVVEQLLVGCSRVAGELLVEGVVDGFDVEQDEVGVLQRLLDCVVEDGSAGVDGCVESFLLAALEKFDEEGGLQERFAAGAGDSSLADEIFVALDFGEELFGGHLVLYGSLGIPCVGVVAVGAPHGTALEKGYKPYSRAVNCAKGLDAVKASFGCLRIGN